MDMKVKDKLLGIEEYKVRKAYVVMSLLSGWTNTAARFYAIFLGMSEKHLFKLLFIKFSLIWYQTQK